MIDIIVACALFTAPIWGNIYLWVTAGSAGFVIEALACAILAVLIFIGCVIYDRTVFSLPLHTATHTLLAFGTTFSAVDLHRGHLYVRCAVLLGFHTALFATFLYESSKKEKESFSKSNP